MSEKAPWVAWIAALLVVAAVVRDSRRRRIRHCAGRPRVKAHEGQSMEGSGIPAWLDEARWYYSEIGGEIADPVSVFDANRPRRGERRDAGNAIPRLEARYLWFTGVRVLDADGHEQGIIRSLGLVPCVRYVMCRNGELVWKLSVRSIVRKRHVLELANGDSWTFDTPFFWWQNLTGTALSAPRLFGGLVVPTKRVWAMWIEPGRDTFDLLAAVAFLHRQYWHW